MEHKKFALFCVVVGVLCLISAGFDCYFGKYLLMKTMMVIGFLNILDGLYWYFKDGE